MPPCCRPIHNINTAYVNSEILLFISLYVYFANRVAYGRTAALTQQRDAGIVHDVILFYRTRTYKMATAITVDE